MVSIHIEKSIAQQASLALIEECRNAISIHTLLLEESSCDLGCTPAA